MKKIHINPQSKGSLGKSFETECRVSYLDRIGVPWFGYDLDDRHATFHDRHPDKVKLFSLEEGAKDAILRMMKDAVNRPEPVVVIDCRAQADLLIRESFESLNMFDYAGYHDAKFVLTLFPSDDNESLVNLGDIVKWGANRAEFIIARNPAKAKGVMFEASPMRDTLLNKFGAHEVVLPNVTPTSLQVLEEVERAHKRAYSFSEFARGVSGVDMIISMEFAYLLGKMETQYISCSGVLLPESEQSKVPKPKNAKPQKPQEPINVSL